MDWCYTVVVVDEAHHFYRRPEARGAIAKHVGSDTRLMLLSDVSQSLGKDL